MFRYPADLPRCSHAREAMLLSTTQGRTIPCGMMRRCSSYFLPPSVSRIRNVMLVMLVWTTCHALNTFSSSCSTSAVFVSGAVLKQNDAVELFDGSTNNNTKKRTLSRARSTSTAPFGAKRNGAKHFAVYWTTLILLFRLCYGDVVAPSAGSEESPSRSLRTPTPPPTPYPIDTTRRRRAEFNLFYVKDQGLLSKNIVKKNRVSGVLINY